MNGDGWTFMDGHWTKLQQMLDEIVTDVKRNGWMDGDYDGNGRQQRRQRYCKVIRIREFCIDGVHKRKEFFFFYFVFLLLLLFSYSSSFRVATRTTHYMTASSKTHKSAQPIC